MEHITYRFTLDVNRNGVQRLLEGFQTGDTSARKLEISLANGSKTFELPTNNITAVMYVTRPNGTTDVNDCVIDGNTIKYEILPGDISAVGTVIMQLKIIGLKKGKPDKVIVSPTFEIDVWASSVDESGAITSSKFTALENALTEAQGFSAKTIRNITIDSDHNMVVEQMDGTKATLTSFGYFFKDLTDIETRALTSEARANSHAEDALNSAGAAQMSAQNANKAFQDAQKEAFDASAHKDMSKNFADESFASAQRAKASEDNAAISVGRASAYAADAQLAAEEAKEAADKAVEADIQEIKGYVDVSKGFADSADLSAEEAKRAETSAQGHESGAQTAASSAQTAAMSSARSAQNASDFASVAAANAALTEQTIKVVTQAQYDAMSEAAKENGAAYLIKDAADGKAEYGEILLQKDAGYLEKNLIPYPYYRGKTYQTNGITFTEKNGTVAAAGTATANAYYVVALRGTPGLFISEGIYRLTGCPKVSGCSLYATYTDAAGSEAIYATDTGNGEYFSVTTLSSDSTNGIVIKVNKGTTLTAVFSPMLVRWDAFLSESFTRRAPSNVELSTMFNQEYTATIDFASVSVPSGYTYTKVCDIAFPSPGIYLVNASASTANLPTTLCGDGKGMRIVCSTSSAASRLTAAAYTFMTTYTYGHVVKLCNVTEANKNSWGIWVMQNSGESITVGPGYEFVKLI